MATRGQLAFSHPDELERLCKTYFKNLRKYATEITTEKKRDGTEIVKQTKVLVDTMPPTMAGLAAHLGVTRQTLTNYKKRDGFFPIIEQAKTQIAAFTEAALLKGTAPNAARFLLEVNHGYRIDDTEGAGAEFHQTVIAPESAEKRTAVVKWEPENAHESDGEPREPVKQKFLGGG